MTRSASNCTKWTVTIVLYQQVHGLIYLWSRGVEECFSCNPFIVERHAPRLRKFLKLIALAEHHSRVSHKFRTLSLWSIIWSNQPSMTAVKNEATATVIVPFLRYSNIICWLIHVAPSVRIVKSLVCLGTSRAKGLRENDSSSDFKAGRHVCVQVFYFYAQPGTSVRTP